jgi:hypothetical protein
MGRDDAAGDQLIANRTREREISDVTSVEVTDFQFADAKFASAEAMLTGSHARPTQQFALDCFADLQPRVHSSFCHAAA